MWEKINSLFRSLIEKDEAIKRIEAKINDGTATHIDTQQFSIRVGEHASEALRKYLTAEALPDGKLYYNIGERTIRPAMERCHNLVNQVGGEIQVRLNRSAGLNLSAVYPDLAEDRIEGIIGRLAVEESISDAAWILDEPIKNLAQSFADSIVRANAEFQSSVGLQPKITRIVVSGCCAWCANLAGTYNYRDAPDDIYRRHDRCRCMVIYDPGDGRRQNVWNRRWF